MAFTYSPSTSLGRVRLNIGDTTNQDYSLNDEEIGIAITDTNTLIMASILAMEWFLARLAFYIDQSHANQQASLRQKYENMERAYDRLKARAKKGGSYVYAGGIEQSRIDNAKEDSEYPQPFARVGQDDRDSDSTDYDDVTS